MFSFHALERNDMMRELLKTDPKKETAGDSIPSKTLKLSAKCAISADIPQNLFNMLSTGNFPDNMKLCRHSTCIQEKRLFNKGKL